MELVPTRILARRSLAVITRMHINLRRQETVDLERNRILPGALNLAVVRENAPT